MINNVDIQFHIEIILKELIKKKNDFSNPSILSGAFGKLIFFAAYDEYYKTDNHKELINSIIKEGIEYINSEMVSNHTLNGLVGFAHGLSILFDNKVVEVVNEEEFFSEIDLFLIDLSEEYIKNNNFDSFYGFIGLGNLMILRSKKNSSISNLLDKNINSIVNHYETLIDGNSEVNIDFSISHGLSSVLHFVSNYAESTSQVNKYKEFIRKLCVFILSHVENNRIPDEIGSNGEILRISPLRWCRGDLSVSYTIGNSSRLINDNKIYEENRKIVEYISSFRNRDEQELYSATICHGTIGVAHLFSKLEGIYDSPEIQMAKSYWYSESLEIMNAKHGYSYIDNKCNHSEVEGILNGMEGIGIGLLILIGGRNLFLDTFLQL